jgi:hypothetical protein
VTVLASDGWTLLHKGETDAHYQLPSGRILWNEALRLRKKKRASGSQFLKLILMEVSARDDDETPVGSAIISVASLSQVAGRRVPVRVAFYIYDCCSLYDDLVCGSALLTRSCLQFSS